MAGSCEHGDKLYGSTKGGKYLDKLNVLLTSQESLRHEFSGRLC